MDDVQSSERSIHHNRPLSNRSSIQSGDECQSHDLLCARRPIMDSVIACIDNFKTVSFVNS